MKWRHAKELLLIINNCTAVGHATNDLKPEFDNWEDEYEFVSD